MTFCCSNSSITVRLLSRDLLEPGWLFADSTTAPTSSPKRREKKHVWLAKHPELTTITCTSFTSLPRRTTDVELSTDRGIAACDLALKCRSELDTSVSQGIEDPRPGSNVRRVRLVLTPQRTQLKPQAGREPCLWL
jgi:hypothetical protein